MSSWLDVVDKNLFRSFHGRLEISEAGQASATNDQARFALLNSQAILCVKGEGAEKFLQGQCTADISSLAVGQSTLGAICTNKGRIISNFRALRTENSVLLRMSADIANETLEQIKKYAVFFKAELSVWGPPSAAVVLSEADLPLDQLPTGIYANPAENGSVELYAEPGHAEQLFNFLDSKAQIVSESAWYAQQIRCGQTSINICTIEQYLPHQLNMDKSGAVSFTKGCYTGQEIIARTEYKGKTKRRVLPTLIEANLGELHNVKLQINDDSKREIEILVAANDDSGKTLAALLLPVEFPVKGSLLMNEEEVAYQLLELPYSIDINE